MSDEMKRDTSSSTVEDLYLGLSKDVDLADKRMSAAMDAVHQRILVEDASLPDISSLPIADGRKQFIEFSVNWLVNSRTVALFSVSSSSSAVKMVCRACREEAILPCTSMGSSACLISPDSYSQISNRSMA